RRLLLLQRLGLAGDPSLADLVRPGFTPPPPPSDAPSTSTAGMVLSRSDGFVEPCSVNRPNPPHRPYHHQHQRSINMPASRKPPLFSRSRPLSTGNFEVSDGDGSSVGGGDRREDGDDGVACDDPRCLIRNLDNGREFVVKEFGEDGMWNKLREVGTGRHLTMDEFEICVGRSPIVQELMRRQNVEEAGQRGGGRTDGFSKGGTRSKKKGSWLRSIKNVAGSAIAGGHHQDRRSSDEKDTSSEKGGRRSSSATDDSQDGSHGLDLRVKVWQYGKSHKELTGLYMSQAIQAHNGSIWSIKFSLDGRYLASAGEDCVIHVWEVSEIHTKGDLMKVAEENVNFKPFALAISNCPLDPRSVLSSVEGSWDKKRRAKIPGGRKSVSLDTVMMPEHVLVLSEKPVCSFRGHVDDVLDLSWSKSQVNLFNPIDDRYFISGSLDEKVRIWSIPDRQIVDWNDLHEMVTAACYTPDGQGVHQSEDSHVYVWKYDEDSRPSRSKPAATVTQSYEHFHCQGVTMAVPWPSSGMGLMMRTDSDKQTEFTGESLANSPLLVEVNGLHLSPSPGSQNIGCQQNSTSSPNSNHFNERVSATWPEELMTNKQSPRSNSDRFNGCMPVQSTSAWGLVIVTASRCGEIRTFQNFGFQFQT
ncbi:hypothetical protein BHM03_00020965, partial [Ensete ventricosum]